MNAVELLPVFEYDELEFQRSKNPRDHMVNIWGYSHASFFAPMSRFGSGGAGPAAAARELKELVRALHGAGIEVILDVVYNHTVEGAHVRLPVTASRLYLRFVSTLWPQRARSRHFRAGTAHDTLEAGSCDAILWSSSVCLPSSPAHALRRSSCD